MEKAVFDGLVEVLQRRAATIVSNCCFACREGHNYCAQLEHECNVSKLN